MYLETPQGMTRMSTSRRARSLIGLLIVLAVTLLPMGVWGKTHLGLGPLWGQEAPFWATVVLILLYIAFVERRAFSSIGFRRPRLLDLVLGAVTGVLLVGGMIAIYTFVFPLLHLQVNIGRLNSIMHTPLWYRVLLVTRAAVSEEILFRGYPIERMQELTGRRWIAAILSIAAFTYAHLSGWGAAQLIVVAYGGTLLAVLYLWRRNLWANMLAHWIADGAGFLLPH
jgi:membrane protease YdiL (CAAX protease family)